MGSWNKIKSKQNKIHFVFVLSWTDELSVVMKNKNAEDGKNDSGAFLKGCSEIRMNSIMKRSHLWPQRLARVMSIGGNAILDQVSLPIVLCSHLILNSFLLDQNDTESIGAAFSECQSMDWGLSP